MRSTAHRSGPSPHVFAEGVRDVSIRMEDNVTVAMSCADHRVGRRLSPRRPDCCVLSRRDAGRHGERGCDVRRVGVGSRIGSPNVSGHPAPALADRLGPDGPDSGDGIPDHVVPAGALSSPGERLRQAAEPGGARHRRAGRGEQRSRAHPPDPGRARRDAGGGRSGTCVSPGAGRVAVGAARSNVNLRRRQCGHLDVCRNRPPVPHARNCSRPPTPSTTRSCVGRLTRSRWPRRAL